jgi:hypothetical protein
VAADRLNDGVICCSSGALLAHIMGAKGDIFGASIHLS